MEDTTARLGLAFSKTVFRISRSTTRTKSIPTSRADPVRRASFLLVRSCEWIGDEGGVGGLRGCCERKAGSEMLKEERSATTDLIKAWMGSFCVRR